MDIEDQYNPLACPHMRKITKSRIYVGCNQDDIFDGKCEKCGWNPKGSHQRMVRRFGTEKAKEFEELSWKLSWYKKPVEEENINDGTV